MQAVLIVTIIAGALAAVGLAVVIFWQQRRLRADLQNMQRQAEQAEQARAQAQSQLQTVLSAGRKFAEAGSEEDIVSWMLRLSMEVSGAMGASFVALDERGQPAGVVRQGDFPFPLPDAWLEYLALPAVRQSCAHCQQVHSFVQNCLLLKGPFSTAMGLYCFPLRQAGRDLGMLNVYMPDERGIDPEKHAFLGSLVDAAALALESERLRRSHLQAISQLQSVRQHADLQPILRTTLANLCESLSADGAVFVLGWPSDEQPLGWCDLLETAATASGDLNKVELFGLEEALQRLWTEHGAQQQLGLADVGLGMALALPLSAVGQQPLGALVLARRRAEPFAPRAVAQAQAQAEQMAWLVQNANQLAERDYQIVIAERTRLAREIHDGLAQTLGFLKLQMAQMLGYLERGDAMPLERMRQSARLSYTALTEAYQDVREAIDMLRQSPGSGSAYRLEDWLRQLAADFAESAALHDFELHLEEVDVQASLPPEVHAQLIRIVQEALSNIRKHSGAHQVWISCNQRPDDLVLDVRDDGRGFAVDDVPALSHHGLRGMRERAEVIGADFQIISRPAEGTIIRIRLPLRGGERVQI